MFKTLLNLFRSTDKNSLEALKQHAEQGDAEAIYQLGRVYALGKGEEVDYDNAMTLYHRANALGYPLAANNIGALYDDMGELKNQWNGLSKAFVKAINERQLVWDDSIF